MGERGERNERKGRKTFRMSLSCLKEAPSQAPDIDMPTNAKARNNARDLVR